MGLGSRAMAVLALALLAAAVASLALHLQFTATSLQAAAVVVSVQLFSALVLAGALSSLVVARELGGQVGAAERLRQHMDTAAELLQGVKDELRQTLRSGRGGSVEVLVEKFRELSRAVEILSAEVRGIYRKYCPCGPDVERAIGAWGAVALEALSLNETVQERSAEPYDAATLSRNMTQVAGELEQGLQQLYLLVGELTKDAGTYLAFTSEKFCASLLAAEASIAAANFITPLYVQHPALAAVAQGILMVPGAYFMWLLPRVLLIPQRTLIP